MMCHDVPVDMLYILEAATHGARVTPAQTIYRRDIELDHSRNVKLDFPDEHLVANVQVIHLAVCWQNTFQEVQRLRLRIQYFTEH